MRGHKMLYVSINLEKIFGNKTGVDKVAIKVVRHLRQTSERDRDNFCHSPYYSPN